MKKMEEQKKKSGIKNLSGDFEYELLGDGTVSVVSYKGNASELVLPAEIEGIQVSQLGEMAFSWCETLNTVKIPEGVSYIGNYAFNYCQNLVGVVLPDSLIGIGNNAFFGCCNLPEISIPKNVSVIGDKAFSSCDHLTAFHVSAENVNFTDEEGVLLNKDRTELCMYPCGKAADSYHVADGVTNIGEYAFYYCTQVGTVKMSDTVQSLKEGAFYGSGIQNIVFSDSVKSIGSYAFAFCKNLETITFTAGITSIGDFAFLSCTNLKSAVIPDGMKNIGNGAFEGCSIS